MAAEDVAGEEVDTLKEELVQLTDASERIAGEPLVGKTPTTGNGGVRSDTSVHCSGH